jgi:hypothetical protein
VTNGRASDIRDLIIAANPDLAPVEIDGQLTDVTGIDVRGDGGQIVVAPTLHPSGKRYEWKRDPFEHLILPPPAWLDDALRPDVDNLVRLIGPPIRVAPPPAPGAVARPDNDQDSIAAWVRDHYGFTEQLEADGWTLHSSPRPDQTWWTRPGKARRDGHSAVLHGIDGPLVVFSTACPAGLATIGTPTQDRSGYTLSLFDYMAGMRFGGDRSAFAADARRTRIRLENRTQISSKDTVAILTLDNTKTRPDEDFIELTQWWDDPPPPKSPEMCITTEGKGFFYLGDLNWVHGDSGSGKTWLALHGARQLVESGRPVIWIHYEDPTPNTVVSRLKQIGAKRADVLERFHFWNHEGGPMDTPALIEASRKVDAAMVVLDSVGEAMAAAGCDENHDLQVGQWLANGPRAIVNAGYGFLAIDHSTKAHETKFHPSGSKRKRAAVTGANVLTEMARASTIHGDDGLYRVFVGKDRHGNWPQGQLAGYLRVDHDLLTGHLNTSIVPKRDGRHDDPNPPADARRPSTDSPLRRERQRHQHRGRRASARHHACRRRARGHGRPARCALPGPRRAGSAIDRRSQHRVRPGARRLR